MPSLSLLILFALLLSSGPSQSQQAEETVLVCSVSAVPYGYVIVGKTSTEQCRINIDLPERDNTLNFQAWLVVRVKSFTLAPPPNT